MHPGRMLPRAGQSHIQKARRSPGAIHMTDIQYKRKFRILLAASQDARLSRGALAVLGYLLDNQNTGESETAVSHRHLATFAGLSITNVSKALARLHDCGFVHETERGNKVRLSRYRVTSPMPSEADMSYSTHVVDDVSETTDVDSDQSHVVDEMAGIVTFKSIAQDASILSMLWAVDGHGDLEVEIDLSSLEGREKLNLIASAAGIDLNNSAPIADQLSEAIFRLEANGKLRPFS
jgi:DNA-binding transcriptional regulator YhcF (GntR family)